MRLPLHDNAMSDLPPPVSAPDLVRAAESRDGRTEPGSSLCAGEPWGPPVPVPAHLRCRIVRQVTAEMVMLVSERVQMRTDRRRSSCHVRQIAMYVCHVILQISLTDIGLAFGRDRTTVGHACNVVEDRRDDRAYDDFVSSVERVVLSVFGAGGGQDHA